MFLTGIINKQVKAKPSAADYKRIRISLELCISCGTCRDSCFIYRNNPCVQNVPAYKVRGTLKPLLKKKINLSVKQVETARDLIWGRCVLCGRCHCPMGIDIPFLLSQARLILRENGISECYERDRMGV